MLSYLAIASIVAPLAWAQSNPLIPTNISSTCATFLQTFNTDTSVASCLTALTAATSAFAPGNPTPSSNTVNTALTTLCSTATSDACPESVIRPQLTSFWSSCQTDLNVPTPNKDVLTLYDVMWTLLPFKSSICAKDDGGNFCALAPATTTRDDTDSPSLSELLATLWNSDNGALKRRAPVDAITPNITTFHDQALPFLFLTPDLDATRLCVSCTRSIITSYVDFASNTPYGPGFSKSLLLDNQPALLAAVNDKCPPTFLGNAIDAAGGIGQNSLFSAASSISVERGTLLAFLMSAATLAAL